MKKKRDKTKENTKRPQGEDLTQPKEVPLFSLGPRSTWTI
jgi:hypothetical protein